MARTIDRIAEAVWGSLTEHEYQELTQAASEWENMTTEQQRAIADIFAKVIVLYDSTSALREPE